MFSRIHDKLGTAGLVVAVAALVVALAGTAIAALPALNSRQKKEVKKIARSFAGKPGASGASGPAGPAGPAGKDGTNGRSVTTGAEPAGTNCPETGGQWFEVEGSGVKKYVCNGKDATLNNQTTLQPGETATGDWSFVIKGVISTYADISYPARMTIVPEVHYIGAPGTSSDPECPGTSPGNPQAQPGELCVYAIEESNVEEVSWFSELDNQIDANSGQVLIFELEDETAEAYAAGSWAVQACPAGATITCASD
jgi:hypothetical protein